MSKIPVTMEGKIATITKGNPDPEDPSQPMNETVDSPDYPSRDEVPQRPYDRGHSFVGADQTAYYTGTFTATTEDTMAPIQDSTVWNPPLLDETVLTNWFAVSTSIARLPSAILKI